MVPFLGKVPILEENTCVKKHWFSILYALCLISFTLYVLLDTFVITRTYQAVATEAPALVAPTATPVPVLQTERAYSDGNISITISEYREHDTTIYVADVILASPSALQTALAENAYGRNITEKTSSMAAEHDALLAINGDYYGSRERGYVLRNGVLYRATAARAQEDLVIWQDGSFSIIQEDEVSAESLLNQGAQQVFSFGPALVVDGQVAVTEADEVGKAMSSNPRTAIAIVDELHYLLVVSDGRTSASEGLSLRELADFLSALGATTAYNLDGGGSSTMVFAGNIINTPTTNGKRVSERSVSDIVFIGY